MSSWVYLFSKFTQEALVIEALVILGLISGYTAFWILKKRRFGSADESVPSIPVRDYLDELIYESEHLREQLFGILEGHQPVSRVDRVRDSDAASQLKQLESKLLEKERSLESLITEKARIAESLEKSEAQIKELKVQLLSGNADGMKSELEAQIRSLEEKLTEYSIIEDDLANLKRFQSENIKLKALLNEKGIPIPTSGGNEPAPSAPDASRAATPASSEPKATNQSKPVEETKANPNAKPGSDTQTEPRLKLVPQPDPLPSKEPELNSVETLLESSLNQGPVPGVSAAAASGPSPKVETPQEKEDDLVKEFEKMLKE